MTAPRRAWAARFALMALVGCVPDTFVFEQGGQSASGAGGLGGVSGVGGGSGGQGGQGGTSGSAIPAEPKCGDGLVNGDEECDPLHPIDDQVFEDELSDALPGPLDLGCTHDCRRIVTWHQDVAVPGGRPVALVAKGSYTLILAGNAPAPIGRFFASMELEDGALTDLSADGPGTFVHDLTTNGTSRFLLASDAIDTPSPSTFIAALGSSTHTLLSFDFDAQAVARYGRAASLFIQRESNQLFALGSSSGSARALAIDYPAWNFGVEDLAVQTPLVGAGPGALISELGGPVTAVAWGDTIVWSVPPERSAELALPDAMINDSCALSDTSGLVVGDYDEGGERAMFAATYTNDGAQLTLTPVDVPLTAPSRALAMACRFPDAFVVGEAGGGAFTLHWSGGQWRERWTHRGPGNRLAGATTVEIERREDQGFLLRAIFVAGWHQTAVGEFPWVQRYAL